MMHGSVFAHDAFMDYNSYMWCCIDMVQQRRHRVFGPDEPDDRTVRGLEQKPGCL